MSMTNLPGDNGGMVPNGLDSSATAPAGGEVIIDVTDQTFVDEVIKRSMDVPVIVDFWAPWCGPCKQLTPDLEKVVSAAGGAVILAKVNIDENNQVAGELGVQSVPTVIGFKQGRPADGFVGAQPESQIKAFIERLAGPVGPSPLEQAMEMAAGALEAKDYQQAANIYAQIMQQEPENVDAIAGLAQCFIGVGEIEQAEGVLTQLPEGAADTPALTAVRAAIKLAHEAENAGPVNELAAKVEAAPDDHQARFDYAVALLGNSKEEEAIDALLTIMRKNREWNDSAARKKLLEVFDALGAEDERTIAGRRQLSSILFS